MTAERRAEVSWSGNLLSGTGKIQFTGSGAIKDLDVTWASRAEPDEAGRTSPEELIAAAHASCFSMALSHALAEEPGRAGQRDVSGLAGPEGQRRGLGRRAARRLGGTSPRPATVPARRESFLELTLEPIGGHVPWRLDVPRDLGRVYRSDGTNPIDVIEDVRSVRVRVAVRLVESSVGRVPSMKQTHGRNYCSREPHSNEKRRRMSLAENSSSEGRAGGSCTSDAACERRVRAGV